MKETTGTIKSVDGMILTLNPEKIGEIQAEKNAVAKIED
jgi:hypothetical protein